MRSLFFYIGIIIVTIGCTNSVNDNIEIELKKHINNSITFNNYYNSFLAKSSYKSYPLYHRDLKLKYNTSSIYDSVFLSTLTLNYKKFQHGLFQGNYIDTISHPNFKFDPMIEEIDLLNYSRSFITYFDNHKQYVLFDSNNNLDMSDEQVLEFDKNFRLEINYERVYNDMPIFDFNFSHEFNGEKFFQNRKVVIYPQSYSCYNRNLSNDEIINKSRILVKFKDYWKGEIKLNNEKYDIAIQGLNPDYLSFLIKPDSLNFSNSNYNDNINFSFKLKDTIKLANKLFQIDTVSKNMDKLVLKKVFIEGEFFSHRPGYLLKNFKLTDINNSKFDIKGYSSSKNFTLLDFWGTWCPPCRKLTPELKRINSTYNPKLNIVGIAVERNIESVKEYVSKNEMNWTQVHIDSKIRSGAINRQLNIDSYPTFILIDSDQNIIYRGVGEPALKEIETLLKSK